MFSETIRYFQAPINALYRERDALQARGEAILDLISGSVEGIAYPQPLLEAALLAGAQRATRYRPDPMGQRVAREAISQYYADEGVSLPADQMLLTPGTSIAYWYAFQLLADAGDEILAPVPSYPLFDAIAHLCRLRMVPYRLDAARGWEIDLGHLQAAITPRSRAIVLISPHNPTGAVASGEALAGVADIATRHHLPLIVDEVFGSFLFEHGTLPRPATGRAPLVITLNGFSKMLALPGMKIGWMALSGETARVKRAMRALSSISDTFLPVNEPAQFAVPALLQRREAFMTEYRKTVRQRRDAAVQSLANHPRLSFTPPMGGFYLTLRVAHPEVDDAQEALGLLRRRRVLVHPGFFYDLPPSHLVMRFVGEPAQLAAGLEALRNDLG